jgi:hypothetical protein
MPAKITDEQHIDAFIGAATKDQLIRLQSDVSAALRWKHGVGQPFIAVRRTRAKKPDAQPVLPGVGKGVE